MGDFVEEGDNEHSNIDGAKKQKKTNWTSGASEFVVPVKSNYILF